MPISLWLRWKAWFKFQGPVGGLKDDYLAADIAFRTAVPYISENDRELVKFLPPWRRPSDYRPWVDFGEDAEPERAEYSVE